MSSAVRYLETPSRQLPDSLDECRLIAALGQGGMAEVFLATRPHQVGEDLVVIKRLHAHLDEDPEVVTMFLDEARIALRLMHPNIVRSYQLGLLQGRHAIVMEYLEGQPIHRVLLRAAALDRAVSCDVVVSLMAAALDGLHHAHEAKADDGSPLSLVHRDVSPHNLFLTCDGHLKLLDFGIAKTEFQECRTRTGLLKGKVSYMAPEHAWGHAIDRRADLWSLGVVFWEMLAGKRLFKAENEAASLHKTLTAAVPKLSSVRSDVPVELERIAARALQRDPAQRFPSAAAMAQELRGWARAHGVSTRPDAARAFFYDLFGDEIAAHRDRVEEILAQAENAPISGSISRPRLQQPAAGTQPGTNVSTTVAVGTREHSTRSLPARWVVLALLGVALGFFALDRFTRPPPSPPTLEVVAPAPSPSVPFETPEPGGPAEVFGTSEPAALPAPSLPSVQRPRVSVRVATRNERTPAPSAAREAPRPPASSEISRDAPAGTRDDFGYLTLDTSPWSNVSAGGVSLGQTPVVRAKLPSGTHTLVLRNPDQNLRTSYQVRIEAGKTTVRRVGLE